MKKILLLLLCALILTSLMGCREPGIPTQETTQEESMAEESDTAEGETESAALVAPFKSRGLTVYWLEDLEDYIPGVSAEY